LKVNNKATAIYERITGLLDEAAQDAAIPPTDFQELLADVYDFCGAGLESFGGGGGEGGEGDDGEEEGEEDEEEEDGEEDGADEVLDD
jgi:hypothetical protein